MGPEADIAAVSSSAGSKAAGNWITKKKAAHLHPALGVNSTYDAQRARLTPKSSFEYVCCYFQDYLDQFHV